MTAETAKKKCAPEGGVVSGVAGAAEVACSMAAGVGEGRKVSLCTAISA